MYQLMPSSGDPDHAPQVRAASLTDYVAVARSVGLDGSRMLREIGIDARLLADPEHRISATAVCELLSASAERSGCDAFGLLLAEKRELPSLGPLSLLLRHESSSRAVLRQLIGHQRLISDILELDLQEEGDEARVIVEVAPEVATRQGVEFVMALTHRFLSDAVFGGWHPAEAHFRYPAPDDLQIYRRTFRTPLRFDAAFNGFLIGAESLDRKNAYANPGFLQHAQNFVNLISRDLPKPSLIAQVRSSIMRLLPARGATLPRVAEQLAMHPRALQRKLAAAGLAFADLADELRAHLARDLLANTNHSLSQVAQLVGYASPASFSRWFTGIAGRPPREWRLRNRTRPDS